MVQAGTEDDHRAAIGLFRIGGEFPRDRDYLVAGKACDPLGPGRRERHVIII